MIDLYSLWLDFQSAVNTSQNGFFRPETDFVRAANEVTVKLWNKWTAKAEKSQEERDKLFPFLKSKNIAVDTATAYYGVAKKPKDYGRLASVRIVVHENNTCPSKEVNDGQCDDWKTDEEFKDEYWDNITEYAARIISDQTWGAFCKHLTKGPSLSNPGITQVNDQFKVAPRKVSVIVLDYYIEPTPATYKYTVVAGNPQTGAGDQLVYNANTSVKLQWPEQMRNELLQELKDWYILHIRDQAGNQINLSQKSVPA